MVVLFMLIVVFSGRVNDDIELFMLSLFFVVFIVMGKVVLLFEVLNVNSVVLCIFFIKIIGFNFEKVFSSIE